MILGASVLSVMIVIFIVVSVVGGLAWKLMAGDLTRCPHCGYESGIPASRARICQKCGLNRLVRKSRKARRR